MGLKRLEALQDLPVWLVFALEMKLGNGAKITNIWNLNFYPPPLLLFVHVSVTFRLRWAMNCAKSFLLPFKIRKIIEIINQPWYPHIEAALGADKSITQIGASTNRPIFI